MYVTVHFGVEHSKNLNRPGTGGYFIKLTTRRQGVNSMCPPACAQQLPGLMCRLAMPEVLPAPQKSQPNIHRDDSIVS
jgi:hypothetical protein